jgi:hypothetical protein
MNHLVDRGECLLNGFSPYLLRNGGYILYARHGQATVGEDRPDLNFQDCATQRNLSSMGRQQAASYGALLRTLQIPIGIPVISSPFCRAAETVWLAFGRNAVQIDPFWANAARLSGTVTPAVREQILNRLQVRLETPPPPGTNQVIIAHGFPDGVGLSRIPDMGTVVIRPLGQGRGYAVAARLSLNDLSEAIYRMA